MAYLLKCIAYGGRSKITYFVIYVHILGGQACIYFMTDGPFSLIKMF